MISWLAGLTYPLTHSLTHSWSWALLEKPPIVQLLKHFPAFYGTGRFITVFTRALHWSLSWARSIQSIPSHLSKIHFNIIPPPKSWSSWWSLSFWFSHQYLSSSSSPFVPCPSHPAWLDHSNYTCRRVQVMKFLIMQFSPTSHHFISLWSKRSSQHPVLKHPQSMLLTYCQRQSFTPIQNHRQNYNLYILIFIANHTVIQYYVIYWKLC
jgi:hypothetical protein